jgi:hypothetical protein
VDPFNGYSANKELENVEENLKGVTLVRQAQHRLAEVFTLVFGENFMNRPYHLWQEPANRSNWTYHTAFAIRETAQTLGLACIFETMGKLDALIETIEKKPRTVLLAEWESDYQSVFGKGKELDKLWKGLSRKRYACALLFTYCPVDKYYSFIKDVIEYWQKKATKSKYPSSLFLPVVVYEAKGSDLVFQLIRTIEILPKEIVLWDDLYF